MLAGVTDDLFVLKVKNESFVLQYYEETDLWLFAANLKLGLNW